VKSARFAIAAIIVFAARIFATASRVLLEARIRTYDETFDALSRELVRLPRMLLIDAILLIVGVIIFAKRGASRPVARSFLAWTAWVFVLAIFGVVHALMHHEPIGDIHRLAQALGFLVWAIVVFPKKKNANADPSPPNIAVLAVLCALTAITISIENSWIQKGIGKLRGLAIGTPAPDFTVPTLSDGTMHLAEHRGELVFVEFWATWCGPCRETLPELGPLRAHFANRGVTFVALEVEGDRMNATRISKSLGVPQDIVALGSDAISDAYRIGSYPHAVLVGRDGKIVRAFRGVYAESEIIAAIDRADSSH
jgi:thiol-disulfide isomerase/thioredoxin